jgi:hypothetical protein
MRVRALVPVAVLSLASPASAADAPKGLWDGYGVGTWVTSKTTSKMTMPGMEAMPESVNESRQTLVKVTDAAWTIKTEMKTGEEWTNAMEMDIPRKAEAVTGTTPKPEDLGTEKVTVEGKDYTCKKQRVTTPAGTVTSWVSEEAGLLKSESTTPSGDTTSTTVTALAKKVKVGTKEVVCREQKSVSKLMGNESTTTFLLSDAVPGHSVRTESTSSMGGGMKSTSVTETTAFEAK